MYEHVGKLDKMLAALSSSSRSKARTLFSRNREALTLSVLSNAQLNILKRKHEEDLAQRFGGLTAAVA